MSNTITLKTSVETWATGEDWMVTRNAATDEIVHAHPTAYVCPVMFVETRGDADVR